MIHSFQISEDDKGWGAKEYYPSKFKKEEKHKVTLCVPPPQKCHVNRKHTQKYTENKMVENESK